MKKMNFDRWAKLYAKEYRNQIKYCDRSGRQRVEVSATFSTISRDLRAKGYLTKSDFVSVCEWKTARPSKRYQKNNERSVRNATELILTDLNDTEAALQVLTNLKGVGVPVASAILTVLDPTKYGIIDYRAYRALLWLQSDDSTFSRYAGFADLTEKWRDYASVAAYLEFVRTIRTIGEAKGLTARTIEMALWKFDEKKGL